MPNAINDFGDRARKYTAPDCFDLPVLRALSQDGHPVCVSCWQFSWEELKQIIDNDGKVYVSLYGGSQPPISVCNQNPAKGMGPKEQIQAELNDRANGLNLLLGEYKQRLEMDISQKEKDFISKDITTRVAEISALRWVLGLEPSNLFKQ